MNKSEFIERLAAKYPQYRSNCIDQAAQFLLNHIAKILGEGGRIEIRSFGSFSVRQREARIGRNPRTGESVFLPHKITPYFKPGKALRARIIQAKLNKVPLKS